MKTLARTKRRREVKDAVLDDCTIAVLVATISTILQHPRPAEYEDEEQSHKRRHEVIRPRLVWDKHADALCREKQFESMYRMSRPSFEKLVRILAPHISKDALQAQRRAGTTISIHAAVHTCIRWLTGGRFHDIRLMTGVSKTTFYGLIHAVIDAINTAVELQPKFPLTQAELAEAADGFEYRSSNGIIRGCIGAIDGWLCPIRVPKQTECGRVISFFSGHYQRYGLNVQACADHHSRFTAFSIRSPGGVNDALAYKAWNLSKVLSEMDAAYFVAGDNAYTQRPHLMTPYNKAQLRDNTQRDNYNYFISQLRIRIEMAFGLAVNKWGILQSPLKIGLSRCPAVVSSCFRLHNYCVTERLLRDGDVVSTHQKRHRYTATVDDPDGSNEFPDPPDGLADLAGEMARTALVQHIANHNMFRPTRSVARRRSEALLY